MSAVALPETWAISSGRLDRVDCDEINLRDDPRGLILTWEAPRQQAKYVLGCDPSFGIPGWQRHLRTDEDRRTDNSAIVIFRLGAIKEVSYDKDGKEVITTRDLQVAEAAGPWDAVECARICNVLGRIYAGEEEDQCELIYEAFPGPGPLMLQELLRLDYGNLWHWEFFADSPAQETGKYGWWSSYRSVPLLWQKTRRHLLKRGCVIRSPWLLDELRSAKVDAAKQTAEVPSPGHDDRIRAFSLAMWAGHKWTADPERSNEPVIESKEINFQTYAPTLGDKRSYRDFWADQVDRWSD